MDTDLLVVGAGAKGTAIAMKAHVLNSLGLGPIAVTIVEATGPAGAWMDGNGVTSSREVLAISPSKDVGFPYQSRGAFGEAGAAVNREAMSFSWQRHLIERGRYAQWVDAGSPPVQRRVYGAYLAWVLSRAVEGVGFVRGRVARVSLAERGERWLVDVAGASGPLPVSLCGVRAHRSGGAPLAAARLRRRAAAVGLRQRTHRDRPRARSSRALTSRSSAAARARSAAWSSSARCAPTRA